MSRLTCLVLLSGLALAGCSPLSVREEDPSAGLNGGFEVFRAGLPVNWYFHDAPLRDDSLDVLADAVDPPEGAQSLKLVVRRTEPAGGVRSAGFFQVVPAEPRRTYRVSFWLRTDGAELRLLLRSEQPERASAPATTSIGPTESDGVRWRRVEDHYTVPDGYATLRVEVDVIRAGTVWIDDLRIEPVDED